VWRLPAELAALLAAARWVANSAGRAALRRATLPYLTLALICVIVFTGNGLSASNVTRAALASPGVMLGVGSLWTLFALPGVHALWTDSRVGHLRAFPIPTAWTTGLLLSWLTLLQLPWFVLWLRGEGLGAACVAVSVVGGFQTVGVLYGSKGRTALLVRAKTPQLALIQALTAHVLRSQKGVFVGVGLLCSAAAGLIGLWLNGHAAEPDAFRPALAIWWTAALLSAGMLHTALSRAEARLTWVLSATATSYRQRSFAVLAPSILLVGGVGGGIGAWFGPTFSFAASGACAALLCACWLRVLWRNTGRDVARSYGLMLLLTATQSVSIARFGLRAALLGALGALLGGALLYFRTSDAC